MYTKMSFIIMEFVKRLPKLRTSITHIIYTEMEMLSILLIKIKMKKAYT